MSVIGQFNRKVGKPGWIIFVIILIIVIWGMYYAE